ncbi:Cellulose binding domain-containing protein [Paenibacillus sp. UNCCL117]|uniref:glycoside hydrolase family 44 protein n=1 Tax=unclassified Paenibacillus TaxID=185978 RepID=UPI00089115E0|nr:MULTISPECIES: glycoside hydrolase family 44 protein [unclassified Paenibacillus]SDC55909.1 Cellulose binding domain-containing protein [Paenibacillus sp. cl123]SFW10874.1 Cellulose binding domain-containing protein [Paenibacillus sp. UNCCL117]
MPLTMNKTSFRFIVVVLVSLFILQTMFTFGAPGRAHAAATFTVSALATPSNVAPGSSVTLNVNVASSEAGSVLVDVEIFNASLTRVKQLVVDNVQIAASGSTNVPFVWEVPANLPEGTYSVSVGIFGAGWSSGMSKWVAGAAHVTVSGGTQSVNFTSSAAVNPETTHPGGTLNVNAAITASQDISALVELRVMQPDGTNVKTETYTEAFVASQTKTMATQWNVPLNAQLGAYRVELGVYNADRSQTYHMNAQAGQFNVTSPTQPSIGIPTNLQAVPSQAAVGLSWNAVTSATYYDLEVDGTIVNNIGTTSYSHTGLQAATSHTYRVRAKNVQLTGEWSSLVTVTTLSEPVSGTIKVQTKTSGSSSSQQLSPGFEITNTGSQPISLSDIRVRYYFTIDTWETMSVNFWTTVNSNSNVLTEIVSMPMTTETADHFLEIGFTADAGLLQPGAKKGVYTWMNKSDWSSFNQTNDYSYRSNSSSYMDNDKVAGLVAGELKWGSSPIPFDLPAFPEQIAVTPTSPTTLLVTWEPVIGATSYDIDADGTVTTNLTSPQFTDQWLNPNIPHTYRVRTHQDSIYGYWSEPITVRMTNASILPPPVNIKATKTTNSISLTWDNLKESVTEYEVETDGLVQSAGSASSYTHSTLTPGSLHSYRVRAKNGLVIGDWSPLIKLNTLSTPTGTFTVDFTVDPSAERAPISPYIYGTNENMTGTENFKSRRMGGNRLTTYNWETNASNSGKDVTGQPNDNYVPFYYGEVPSSQYNIPGIAVTAFHEKSLAQGALSLVTLQAAGYVANDKNGSVSASQTAPSARWAEVKAKKNTPFSLVPDVTDQVDYMDEFVNFLVNRFGNASTPNGVKAYLIDNEAGLWSETHPYMHPAPAGGAEVLNKSIELAKAVKNIDPYAQIFGLGAYGFSEFYNMQQAPDWSQLKGNYDWYMDYYLDKMRRESAKEGKRLLDVLDVHWYPEATGGGVRVTRSDTNNNIEANKARIQATRTLWDPSYKETSWITGNSNFFSFLPLIPRLQQSIDLYNEDTKIGFSEYNYGGENHISGGIALADVLGIFGKTGVYSAQYWKTVKQVSDAPYSSAAFRIFNNYDGNKSEYGNIKVQAETNNIENSAIYGSVFADSNNNLHLIAINKNYDYDMNAVFHIGGETYSAARVWAFDSNSSVITERQPITQINGSSFSYTIPKLTVCHIVLTKTSAGQ